MRVQSKLVPAPAQIRVATEQARDGMSRAARRQRLRVLPALSIVIPTLNEAQNIGELLRRVQETMSSNDLVYEVLIVDDHSIDDTVAVAERTIADLRMPARVQVKRGKPGKTYSLIEGLDAARFEALATLDGDLQYPPEALPDLLGMLSGADVVVGDRRLSYSTVSAGRGMSSRLFNMVVGRGILSLDTDIQSGMKVFRREVYESSLLRPGPWSFDLELLAAAHENGYRIASSIITMQPRGGGQSKARVAHVAAELGLRALAVRLHLATHTAEEDASELARLATRNGQPKPPALAESSDQARRYERWLMYEAGQAAEAHAQGEQARYAQAAEEEEVTHGGQRFRPFAPHQPQYSALRTFTRGQVIALSVIALLWLAALVAFGLSALTITLGAVTTLYLFDLAVTMFISLGSLRSGAAAPFDDQMVRSIHNEYWPAYTILCPLYHEAEVAAQFTRAIQMLDYPLDRLQVLLLTEEDDDETRAALLRMDLPDHFEVVTVPDGKPRTKPRACNYGLLRATGDFVVIFDAEDIPDPLQLKKAALTFAQGDTDLACVQASLSFYNPSQNLLTRWFTSEYSLWFDLTLPALQRMKSFLPLGGTSNHFRTRVLREVGGWDPFNVTEDCDLGVRLAQYHYRTAMVASTTYEEANPNLRNWLRQRSRWVKGYMQTYLVYMRNPLRYVREGRMGELFWLQVIVGGRSLTQLINPLLWLLLAVYIVFHQWVTPIYHVLYPAPVFYASAFCLVFGNFFYVYSYLIGCLNRRHYLLTLWSLLIPFYWALMSIASYIALYQLLTRPYYWEKTQHGLVAQRGGHLAESLGACGVWLRGVARGSVRSGRMAGAWLATRLHVPAEPRWALALGAGARQSSAWLARLARPVLAAPLIRGASAYLAHEVAMVRRELSRSGQQQAWLAPALALPVAPVVDMLSTTALPALRLKTSRGSITVVSKRETSYMAAVRPITHPLQASQRPRRVSLRWLRDRWLLATLATAITTSISACVYFFSHGETLLYNDAESHMRLARMPFDGVTTGLAQLGTAWLPLPHILMMPFVMNDYLWSTGLAGAFVGMMAYVVAAVYVFKIARLLSGSGAAAYIGALVLMLNPNLLYLQATPLSEAVLVAVMAGACYYFLIWAQTGEMRHLLQATAGGWLATLTRYEGWSLFIALTLLIVAVGVLKRRSVRRIIGEALFFATPGACVIALWLTWNYLLTGNPLFFQNGPYSATAQQSVILASGLLPTYHNLGMSVLTYGADLLEYTGPLVVALALLGAFVFARRAWRRPEGIAALALVAPTMLYLYTLYKGQIVIYVPVISAHMPNDLFNVRYATSALIPFAVFVATLIARRRVLGIIAIALIVAQALLTATGGIITLQDGQHGSSCLQFKQSDIFLAEHYNGGRILSDPYGNPQAFDVLGIDYSNVVYVGSYQIWDEALANPAHYVDWVIVRPGDAVSQKINVNSATFTSQFILVERDSSGDEVFYKRGLPQLPNRSQPTQLMQRYAQCNPQYNVNNLGAFAAPTAHPVASPATLALGDTRAQVGAQVGAPVEWKLRS